MNRPTQKDVEKVRSRLRQEGGYTEHQLTNASIAQIEDNKWGDSQFHVSIPVFPKEFIRQVLIDELEHVCKTSPWLSFGNIGNGIEFLGKCLDSGATDWDKTGVSKQNFNDAIRALASLKKYEPYLDRADGFKLYTEFRCGLTHAMAPKGRISLSSKDEAKNLTEFYGAVNFHIDELYADFRAACEEVIAKTYPYGDKMSRPRIFINLTIPIRKG
jgi:hypothetical protein